MIIGIGTDLMNIRRLASLEPDDAFFRLTFTEKERESSKVRPNPMLYLAERFAVKEAVFKAVGIDADPVRLNEIETLNQANGAPFVALYGKFQALAKEREIRRIHLSLSSDGDFVQAFVILTNDG